MTSSFTLALAQINTLVGDLHGNAARMEQYARDAAREGADLVLYPEMCLTGYPPEDLILIPAFREAAMQVAQALATATRDLPCDLMFGSVWERSELGEPAMSPRHASHAPDSHAERDGAKGLSADKTAASRRHIYNASLLAAKGVLTVVREKHDLPNYGVFDEKRVFDVGAEPSVVAWRGVKLGVLICEEVWDVNAAKALAAQGAEILVVQNASPYHIGKAGQRKKVVDAAVAATGLPLVYLNLIGGQDELVFDGRSYAVGVEGHDVARLPAFMEALGITVWEKKSSTGSAASAASPLAGEATRLSASALSRSGEGDSAVHSPSSTVPSPELLSIPPNGDGSNPSSPARGEGSPAVPLADTSAAWQCTSAPMVEISTDERTIYHALVLGLRDYVAKNNFPGVVLGLSGGIDSGLTAAIAADALGADKVHTIRLPSPFTSDDSLEDAEQLAAALGIRMDTIPITPLIDTSRQTLAPLFQGLHADTTEENIQARLRGLLLMGLSNKLGAMVLTTGNKSEMSVGYATLYGDMCGGFSVLKDVYKTTVTKLSIWRTAQKAEALREYGFLGAASTLTHPVIPSRMITKPPTAELRPNQRDDDSLPPYAVLDAILRGLIERQLSVAELVAEGQDKLTVDRVARMVAGAEYKRRQSAPGVKITPMAFGRDRRWPITNRWKFG